MLAEASTEVASHALDRIERAEVQTEPFPHIIVDHFLPDAFFADLISHFPERSEFQQVTYPGTGHGKRTSRYQECGLSYRNLKGHEYLRIVDDLFGSPAFSQALLEKFSRQCANGSTPIPKAKHAFFSDGNSDYTCVYDFQIDMPGYEIPPHPDVPQKIVTFQFFMVDDDSLRDFGTLFCKPKNGQATVDRGALASATGWFVDRTAGLLHLQESGPYRRFEQSPLGLTCGVGATRNWLPWNLFDVAKIAPALPNHFMAFAPNKISYHAVRMDIPPELPRQERPVIRGFIRSGKNTNNWIKPVQM